MTMKYNDETYTVVSNGISMFAKYQLKQYERKRVQIYIQEKHLVNF